MQNYKFICKTCNEQSHVYLRTSIVIFREKQCHNSQMNNKKRVIRIIINQGGKSIISTYKQMTKRKKTGYYHYV